MNNLAILMRLAAYASAILAVFAGAGVAQTISTGPLSGSVFDTVSHSIRSIVGVPGAAVLGGSAASTWDLAAASPDGAKAVAIRAGQTYFIADLTQPDAATPIGTGIGDVDRIAWSADSSTAALFSSRSGQLQRITGFGSTPAIGPAIGLADAGEVSAWKIGPDGNTIAWAAVTSGSGSAYVISGSNPAVRLGSFQDPRALAFSPDGASLFVFDRATQQIFQVNVSTGATVGSFAVSAPPGSTAQSLSAASARPGVRRAPPRAVAGPDISDMAVSAGNSALLALRGDSLCSFDLSGSNPETCTALEVSPASIDEISPGLLMLNYARGTGSPVWIWDVSADQAFFVPSGVINAGN